MFLVYVGSAVRSKRLLFRCDTINEARDKATIAHHVIKTMGIGPSGNHFDARHTSSVSCVLIEDGVGNIIEQYGSM